MSALLLLALSLFPAEYDAEYDECAPYYGSGPVTPGQASLALAALHASDELALAGDDALAALQTACIASADGSDAAIADCGGDY